MKTTQEMIDQLQNPPAAPKTLIFRGVDTGISPSNDPGGARALLLIEDGGLPIYLRMRDQYGIRFKEELREVIEKILLDEALASDPPREYGPRGYYGVTFSLQQNKRLAKANELIDEYNSKINQQKTHTEQLNLQKNLDLKIQSILLGL